MKPVPLPAAINAALALVAVFGLGLTALALQTNLTGSAGLLGVSVLCIGLLAALGQLWRLFRHQARVQARDRIQMRNIMDAQQRWQLALESARDGLWDWNPQDGTLILSRQWTAMLGYQEKDVQGKSSEWLRLMHPDDQEATLACLQSHLDGHTPHFAAEFRLMAQDGHWHWIQGRGQVIERDPRARPLRMIGTHTDIHAQKTAELALRRHEAELAAIFELSPDGIVTVTADGRVHAVNPAFERLTGLGAGDLVGQGASTLDALLVARSEHPELPLANPVGPDDAHAAEARTAPGCAPCRIDLRLPRHRTLQRSCSLLTDHPLQAVQHYRDITPYVTLDEAKTEFIKAASIHLRGPLASVYGYSELLLGEDYDPVTQRDLLDTIYKHSRQLVNLVNDLLDLNHIRPVGSDAETDEGLTIPLDLRHLAEDAVSGFRRLRDRWPIEVERPAEPISVLGQADALGRALRNVLDNAVKFSPEGSPIRIRMSRCQDADGRAWAVIHISDRGIGLSDAERVRVFEPFYKADSTGQTPGSGLGLPIVKQIVEAHRGQVSVESELGRGTTVSLWLPAAPVLSGLPPVPEAARPNIAKDDR